MFTVTLKSTGDYRITDVGATIYAADGRRWVLLGQVYMPAQVMHVLRAPDGQQIDGPETINLKAGDVHKVAFR